MVCVDHYGAVLGYGAQQVLKLFFNIVNGVEDVGVVELKITQYQNLRAVVQKLGSLIKKGRVILISLDNEPFALAQSG